MKGRETSRPLGCCAKDVTLSLVVIGIAEVALVVLTVFSLPLSFTATCLKALVRFKLESVVRVPLVEVRFILVSQVGESMCCPMKGTSVIRRIKVAKRNNTLNPGMILILVVPIMAPFRFL